MYFIYFLSMCYNSRSIQRLAEIPDYWDVKVEVKKEEKEEYTEISYNFNTIKFIHVIYKDPNSKLSVDGSLKIIVDYNKEISCGYKRLGSKTALFRFYSKNVESHGNHYLKYFLDAKFKLDKIEYNILQNCLELLPRHIREIGSDLIEHFCS